MIQADLFEELILPLYEEHRADWLSEARSTALSLCLRNGSATIDDVRDHCPPPDDVDPRVMGAVFATRDFVAVGYEKSRRRTCHNRPVAIFKLSSQTTKVA